MNKLLYSVRELFSNEPLNGCLGITEASGYYIAPYQRGYKWQSSKEWSSPDQVNTLLRDIYDAWKRNPNSTYYLQFITVKRVLLKQDNRPYLEVIDGQQRLTTLSILSAVLKHKYPSLEDFSRDKIEYYNASQCLSGFHASPPLIEEEDSKITDQTIWFMTRAYRNLSSLLADKFPNNDDTLSRFFKYLCNKTLVIVNLVQDNIKSEEVFENLNGRKIPLTDGELIKGLLLCQAARHSKNISFNEVLERRAVMGRTWDAMERWFHKPEVGPFFFGDGQAPVYDFLLLVISMRMFIKSSSDSKENKEKKKAFETQLQLLYDARQEQTPSRTKRYRLFNEFYSRIAEPDNAQDLFRTIEDWYWRLRDAFEDVARHNAFGFLLFRQEGIKRLQLIAELINFGPDWQTAVCQKIRDIYKKTDTSNGLKLFCENYVKQYNGASEPLRQDLLLLNCFVIENDGKFKPNDKLAFPFYDGPGESPMVSLEHVQCQNPIGIMKGELLTPERMAEKMSDEGDAIFDKLFLIRDAERILQFQDVYTAEAEALNKIIGSEPDQDIYRDIIKNAKAFESGRKKWDDFSNEEKQGLADIYLKLINIHYGRFLQPLSKVSEGNFSGTEIECLHSIGNLVLVTGALNTAFSNNTFRAKRTILRDKVNEGATVPPQTFNVFTKMSGEDSHADCWCAEDAEENAYETLGQLFKLINALQNEENSGGIE